MDLAAETPEPLRPLPPFVARQRLAAAVRHATEEVDRLKSAGTDLLHVSQRVVDVVRQVEDAVTRVRARL